MLQALKQRREDEQGFTLIELMVVVLIIAILLAIAIPTFLGAQDRARDRGAQSDLRNALTAAKTVATDHEGAFSQDLAGTAIDAALMEATEPSLTFSDTAADVETLPTIIVAVSDGLLSDATEGTTNGVIFLDRKSGSGKYFGVCTDYTGAVLYAQDDAAQVVLADCVDERW